MRIYNTVNDVLNETRTLHRNLTGKEQLTAAEDDIVNSAIVDSYQQVLLEHGIEDFKFHEQDFTVTCVAGTNYVELDEYMFRIVPGSMRIPSEEQMLTLLNEAEIFDIDPNDEQTGLPTVFAYKNSGDPNVVRVRLYPNPDQAYVVAGKGLQLPTDVITNFPTHLMGPIKNKAKELSAVGLGLFNAAIPFRAIYEEQMAKIKSIYNDSPQHVARTFIRTRRRSIENRVSN